VNKVTENKKTEESEKIMKKVKKKSKKIKDNDNHEIQHKELLNESVEQERIKRMLTMV
jgi:hypothetical protein